MGIELLIYIIVGASIGSTVGAGIGAATDGIENGTREALKILARAAGFSLLVYTAVTLAKKK